jgi:phosphatidylethanolamine/phosphatidyl-N-methylethanolamine N-methyltransferase
MRRGTSLAFSAPMSLAALYTTLASSYDALFGPILQAGRVAAVRQISRATHGRVLEVGVGTAMDALLYPRSFTVDGIDLSSRMLEQARERIARHGLRHVRVHQMDAACLGFRDGAFDVVYAPYVISVVKDPERTLREMRRVCRPGGTILVLNHFQSADPWTATLERAISPCTTRVGFRADLNLPQLLRGAELTPTLIKKVNFPPIWSLVTCSN